ncbi:hypothetical protein DLREEDagrD3_15160 [Denitratisoma sp. agr-D3]
MRFIPSALTAALAASILISTPALAAPQWQKLASARGAELDVSRISAVEAGRVQAWSRLALHKAVTDEESGTTYNTVEVLNSYDCAAKRYTAVKRLYLDGDKVLRVEPIYAFKDQPAKSGVEAAMLKEVCRRPTVQTAQRKADKGDGDKRFSVMHAELVTNGKDNLARVMPVADKAPDSGKVEPPKRMIDLPKIDSSQVEKPGDGKPVEGSTVKALEKTNCDKCPPDAKPGDKSAAAAAVNALSGLDRRSREVALATAGPRRVTSKKKPAPKKEIHWSYEGEGGPENWAKIDSKNALCGSGLRQSPIDIGEGVKVDLEGIRFDYRPQRVRIEDNGHTIQVNVNEGNVIRVMGRSYELKQLHFHRPSEEKVGGKRFDMVAHLVHKDDEGHIAVVAVLLERGEVEQPVIQTIWNNMPLEAGSSTNPPQPLDVAKLLPQDRSYYTYMGSLTTPPCDEGVLWMVFKQPVVITPEQLAVFSRVYKNNARPTQPSNGRLIKESR